MTPRFEAICVLALAIATSAGARADGPASAATPDATFSRGLASYESKRWSEAIETWEGLVRSLGEERGFKVLYNLGLAYEAAGDATRAIERFEAFLRHLAAQPAALSRELEERRQDAAERSRALKAGRGAVAVPESPGRENAVRIDGAAARAAGFTAYLSPGEHAIELFSGSRDARTERVRVEAGGKLTLDTRPPATPLSPPQVVVVTAPETPPAFPTVWVVGGGALALASFALPIGLGLRAAEARSEALALGRGHTQYAAAARRFEEARGAYSASFTAPAALGVVTLAVAAVSLVRVRTYHPKDGSGAAALSIAPGGVWLTGQF